MPTHHFYVPSIMCADCANTIQAGLSRIQHVNSIGVDIISTKVTVVTNETDNTDTRKILSDTLDEIGHPEEAEYTAESIIDPNIIVKHVVNNPKHRSKTTRGYWIKGLIGVLSGAAMMALCIWGMGIPLIAMAIIGGISSLLTIYLGKDTYKRAATHLVKSKKLSMESLYTLSTLLAISVSCISFFIPWLPMMFDAALLIFGFKHIGTAIKDTAKQQATKISFRNYAPKEIEVGESIKDTAIKQVKDIQPGTIIIVRSGQTVPLDGKCLDKNKSIIKKFFTGSIIPQPIEENTLIYAGSIVPRNISYIRIKVESNEEKSYLVQSAKEAELAESIKAPIEITTNRLLKYFIRTVFVIAAVSAIVAGILISPFAAFQCAASVLVAACPCTLGLIIPLAIKTGIAKGIEHGVTFKSGKSIQAAADIDTVVFDLNGTLTTGMPKVVKSSVPHEFLAHLEAMEKDSHNPIAKGIVEYAQSKNTLALKKNITYTTDHMGITAKIDNDNFAVGNSKMMKSLGIDTSKHEDELALTDAEHMIYFVRNNQIIGTILLKDPLRDDAKQTIKELKRLGKTIHICTGAGVETAEKYAKELEVTHIKADCSSSNKTKYIQELTKTNKVAMIGDAANDATAVSVSHFGIAIKSAASDEITEKKAGATINNGSLWTITNAFSIANQTTSNIKQNLIATATYNLLAMVLFGGLLVAVGFAINPAIGALMMVVQVGLILMNLERFKRQKIPELTPQTEFKSTHTTLASTFQPSTPQLDSKPSIQYSSTPNNNTVYHFNKMTPTLRKPTTDVELNNHLTQLSYKS